MNLLKSFEQIVKLGTNNLKDNIKFKEQKKNESVQKLSSEESQSLQLYPFRQKTIIASSDSVEAIKDLSTEKSIKQDLTKSNNFKPYEKSDYKKIDRTNTYYVLYVIDGDTFVALHQGEKINVRLAGINAPEKITTKGKASKLFLDELIKKKNVWFDVKGYDKYGRQICNIFLDEKKSECVNSILISEGYATSERYRNNENKLTHSGFSHLSNEFQEAKAKFTGKGNWR